MTDDEPERRLWAAVLKRAATDASRSGMHQATTARRRAERARLRLWAGTDDMRAACAMAGVDPAAFRDEILARTAELPADASPYVDASPYAGLPQAVRDEVELTQLDRPRYMDYLRTLADPSAAARRHLDAGLTVEAALGHG